MSSTSTARSSTAPPMSVPSTSSRWPLTPIEFDILWMLWREPGQVISAERLFETVWGKKYLDRNKRHGPHPPSARENGGAQPNPRFIKTVWGVGV